MSRSDPQLKIRLPESLKEKLEAAAASNNRSMNAEIISILEDILADSDDVNTLLAPIKLSQKIVEGMKARSIHKLEEATFKPLKAEYKKYLSFLLRYDRQLENCVRSIQVIRSRQRMILRVDNNLEKNPQTISELKRLISLLDEQDIANFEDILSRHREKSIYENITDELVDFVNRKIFRKNLTKNSSSDLKKPADL